MNPTGTREDGFTAYYGGDYGRARALLTPLAERGDADAMCAVGSMYQLGLGVAPDPQAARRWYIRAGELGSGLAYNNLATMYAAGCADLEADMGQARAYWRKAAEKGFEVPQR